MLYLFSQQIFLKDAICYQTPEWASGKPTESKHSSCPWVYSLVLPSPDLIFTAVAREILPLLAEKEMAA